MSLTAICNVSPLRDELVRYNYYYNYYDGTMGCHHWRIYVLLGDSGHSRSINIRVQTLFYRLFTVPYFSVRS